MPLRPLPVDEVVPQVVRAVVAGRGVVLRAPPGAGKTTRVPPALVDALPPAAGQVLLLQPRRVAARAAAARIAEERGLALGDEVGYQVRFERRAGPRTRLLVMTEGLFLRRLLDDPLLEGVAAVVFDEFHERNLDADLALAMVQRVRTQVRPELAVVVMSATLDAAPIVAWLGDAEAVECPGRAFPVAIEYAPFEPTGPLEDRAVAAVRELLPRAEGDLLVFLPGVGEIRRAAERLADLADGGAWVVLPLHGELPLDEQQRVLAPHPRRKLILATNVAETSLTIDGVRTVIDTGYARIACHDPHRGLGRLETRRIARASAEQRAGRAGRTAPGRCLRLWTERQHAALEPFERPEIERAELSAAVLQLRAWGETRLDEFPWFEPPPAAALERAESLLRLLGALDARGLTDVGRAMTAWPLEPRLARLMVEATRAGVADAAARLAALLSERDIVRHGTAPRRAGHRSDSDLLDALHALDAFAARGTRHAAIGELYPPAADRALRVAEQLARIAPPREAGSPPRRADLRGADADTALRRALLTAFPDRLCRRREPHGRRAVMVGGRGVRLDDASAVAEAELFLALDMADAGQAESRVTWASAVEREWLDPAQLRVVHEVRYDPARERVVAVRQTRFADLLLDEGPSPLPVDVDPGPILAAGVAAAGDPAQYADEAAQRYLARVACLRQWLPEAGLPDWGPEPWRALLDAWSAGRQSTAELRAAALDTVAAALTPAQRALVEREAPERLSVPSGSRVPLTYEPGRPPVLAVRIQELFGLAETPRIASGRVRVLVHLLAPNYRVQQITDDLASFWRNTYPEVRKELKRRYPKHAWPDEPLTARPERRPTRRPAE